MPDDKEELLQGIAIWESLIPHLWCDVCALLLLCRKADKAGRTPSVTDKDFLAYFDNLSGGLPQERRYLLSTLRDSKGREFANPYLPRGNNDDEHLRIGLFARHQRREALYSRLTSLVINAFHQAREGHVRSPESELVPSPLYIISQFLTDPDDLASSGYAFQACRNWLSEVLQMWPSSESSLEQLERPKDAIVFGVGELSAAMASFENHERIQLRWPNPRFERAKSSQDESAAEKQFRINSYVGHLLALKGNATLWFRRGQSEPAATADSFLTIPVELRSDRNAQRVLNYRIADSLELPRFRKSTQHHLFPDFEEVANQVFGVPLPIKGMDVVLNGGLRASDKGGLVVSVRGAPGTGKTSLALAIANALAPFGIPTSFVALEESEGDVRNKLKLMSQYGRSRLSITQGNEAHFFCVDAHSKDLDSFTSLRIETGVLYKEVQDALAQNARRVPHLPFAGVVVIDNINMLGLSKGGRADSKERDIEEVGLMIKAWRDSRLLSIVISAQDVAADLRIDYLADVVIEMRFADLDAINKKPLRILNIVKTRHQSARQGAHLFHMTGGKGFRVVPHMDSLMTKKAGIRRRLPDWNQIIDIFKADQARSNDPYLRVYQGSNVLIHGFGSGGKAGLALKLLSKKPSPNKQAAEEPKRKQLFYPVTTAHLPLRVLIVSFLYPDDYYRQLAYRINVGDPHGDMDRDSGIEPLILSPGFLTPQDFLNMVVSRLDEAVVAGRPFTGVMVDGLHNVFLQYELLQDSSVVWAMLYSILSRYNISVVSTFTNFSLNDRFLPGLDDQGARHAATASIEDQELMQKGMTPFLHALVKATDFYLYLQEEIEPASNKRTYVLSVRTAIRQEVPEDYLIWDRQALTFTTRLTPAAIRKKFARPKPDSLTESR